MQEVYLGIDWHKKSSTWVALDSDRNVVWERQKVACAPDAVRAAYQEVSAVSSDVRGAIEPVWGWRWASDLLEELGGDIRIANPIKLKQIAQSATKNDRNDAYTLADTHRGKLLPEAYKCSQEVYTLREYVRTRGYLVRLRTGVKCRIHAYCAERGLHTTSTAPLSAKGRVTLLQQGDPVLLSMFHVLDDVTVQINDLERLIKHQTDATPDIQRLLTMPGIGLVSAASIYAEVADFSRFPTAKHLVSYAGLNPRERSSGERQRFGRISKEGSGMLRYTLVECAMRVRNVSENQYLYAFYDRLRTQQKKSPMVARVALARKMLTALWYMMHRAEDYNDALLAPAQRQDDSVLRD